MGNEETVKDSSFFILHSSFYLPPEWAEQEAVQLTWPHTGTDWAYMLPEITDTYINMAAEIAKRERLIIVAPDADTMDDVLDRIFELAPGGDIMVVECDTDDTWARDHGFITLTDCKGGKRLLDFRFNGWGEKFAADNDNAINRNLYEMEVVEGEYENHLDFVLEGGSIESDGKGTVFTTSPCLLAPHRNQPLTKEQIEEELKRRLRASRVVWINHGNLTGDDTDGHIDTLVRVAPDDTLLYIGCDDENDEQYAELHAMEEELKSLRTESGEPYRLLRLPMPAPIIIDGERLPATYANFLVINGAVLVPTYSQPDNDRRAMEIIAQAFPDREMVAIDSVQIIRQHGSIHCCTMQFPCKPSGEPSLLGLS